MSEYTKQLTAEGLIFYIATDYVELSHDKIKWQRDDYIKICREWIQHHYPLDEVIPDTSTDNSDYDF